MMGIPLDGSSWMLGDNLSVITSSTIPHSTLNKHHNALSYHRVREALAAGIIYFVHVEGKYNPSDILTKFLGWVKFWPLVQPFLFWKGETLIEDTPIPLIIRDLVDNPVSDLRGVTDCDQSNGVNSSTELTNKHYSSIHNENLNPMVFESSKSDHGFPSYKHPK